MEAVLPSAWLSQGAECVLVLTTSTWTGTMSPAQVSHFKPTRTENMHEDRDFLSTFSLNDKILILS